MRSKITHVIFCILSILTPIVGIVLFFVDKDKIDERGEMAGKYFGFALLGIVINILILLGWF